MASSQDELERFIVGKCYTLGFVTAERPGGEVWIADPWDADYLGASEKQLRQTAYVARAKGFIQLDSTLIFAQPSDQLLRTGLRDDQALDGNIRKNPQALSQLPKKDALIGDSEKILNGGSGLAFLVIDLDHFKQVNDTWGHQEGDACLDRVLKILIAVIGRKGTLYRWGGDEFVVSLPDFSIEEALATAERIRRAIEESKPGGTINVTCSIGVSSNEQLDCDTAEGLLTAADKAMYESKQRGKNRVCAHPGIHSDSDKVPSDRA